MTDLDLGATEGAQDETKTGRDAGDELPQHDAGELWQPYVDRPLLTPHMIVGLDEAPPNDQERLLRYLAALVAVRQAPVHVNVAFNAVYFGFDLISRGYVGGALNDLFAFPEVYVERGGDALPVGALVNLAPGHRPLFVEVVYKEGAHPELGGDGSLPEWLSGAPAGATGPGKVRPDAQPVLRERLVVDTDAFGAELSMTAQQLIRLRRSGRALDEDGHVLLEARYASREEADLDEVSYYARYLLTRGREQLLSASAPLPLAALLTSDAGNEEYEVALLGLLRTVSEALERIDGLRMWRGYAFTRASMAARLKDGGPLGGGDLETVATQLRLGAVPDRPSRWAPARKVTYTAIGPRLRTLRGARERLSGPGYALAVCHANAVLSDYVRGESDETTGLLPAEVSLRLDDPWQGGGVWRAEHPGSADARIDITQPLGLGWASTLPSEARMIAVVDPTPELMLEEDGGGDDDAHELTVSDSQISWTQPLRLSHQLDERLPVPELVASAMRGVVPRLRLLLTHDGYPLDPHQAQQDTDTELYGSLPHLAGIDWPLEFFPGIILTCTWPRGGGVIKATSTLLDEPVTVDGMEIQHRYDPAILTRETAPGEGRRSSEGQGSSTGPAGTLTLAQRVLRAVRRLGRLDPDGRAVLARSVLPRAVYGNTSTVDEALDDVVDRLVRNGELGVGMANVDGGMLQFPAVPGLHTIEVLVYVPSIVVGLPAQRHWPAQHTLDARFLRTAEVAGHLRRIGHLGWEASQAKRDAYREDRRRLGLVGPADLPPGYTYVPSFSRGT